jgi:hypothetical protein
VASRCIPRIPAGWIAVPAMLLGILGGLHTPSPAALFRR